MLYIHKSDKVYITKFSLIYNTIYYQMRLSEPQVIWERSLQLLYRNTFDFFSGENDILGWRQLYAQGISSSRDIGTLLDQAYQQRWDLAVIHY